jgi:WD40 repeat protein
MPDPRTRSNEKFCIAWGEHVSAEPPFPIIEQHLPAQTDVDEGSYREIALDLIDLDVSTRADRGLPVRLADYREYHEWLRTEELLADLVREEWRSRGGKVSTVEEISRDYAKDFPGLWGDLRPILGRLIPRLPPGFTWLAGPFKGGMGVVCQAEDNLSRVVALKMIRFRETDHPGMKDERVARFKAEARAMARVRHPNIVSVYGGDEYDGCPYYSMEWSSEGDLGQYLKKHPMPPKAIAAWFEQLASALAFIHESRFVHRDLKLSNILVTRSCGIDLPKISDLGLVKVMADELRRSDVQATQAGGEMGTLPYMAPEQFLSAANANALSDVYSLGAVLYECLTGQWPFTGSRFDIINKLSNPAVEPRKIRPLAPGVHRDLETITLKCLMKVQGERYESAEALANDLKRFVRGEPILARPPGLLERFSKAVRRHPAGSAATALILLFASGLLTIGALLWWTSSQLSKTEDALRGEKTALGNEVVAKDEAQQLLYVRNINAAQRALEANRIVFAKDVLGACASDRRGWEWHLLAQLCDGAQRTVLPHPDWVESVQFSRDGALLATGGGNADDPTIRIWSSLDGTELKRLTGHKDRITAIRFHPHKHWLFSASSDGTVKVWDIGSGKEVRELHKSRPEVLGLELTADGGRLAVGFGRGLTIYSTDTGKAEPPHPVVSSTSVLAMSFRDGGTCLAAGVFGNNGHGIRIWDTSTKKYLAPPFLHKQNITRAGFSPDAKLLATASQDKSLRIWDVMTGSLVCSWQSQSARSNATSVAFSPDGKRVAISSEHDPVQVWDLPRRPGDDPTPLFTYRGHSAPVRSVTFKPDGKTLATAGWDRTARTWDLASHRHPSILMSHAGSVTSLAASPKGPLIASAGHDGVIKLWHAGTGRLLSELPGHEAGVACLAFRPDGERLASGGADGLARVWNTATGTCENILRGHRGTVAAVAFSPNGTQIGTGGVDKIVRIWDAATGLMRGSFEGHTEAITSLTYAGGEGRLASGSRDKTLRVWDLSLRRMASEPFRHSGPVHSVVYRGGDGSLITSSAGSLYFPGEIRVWDSRMGVSRAFAKTYDFVSPENLTLSPDGKRLGVACTDRSVKLFDIQTGGEMLSLSHPNFVHGVAFSADGHLLLSGCQDKIVWGWNAAPMSDRSRH